MQTVAAKRYNLSMQQARLWSLQGESNAYHTQCAIQMDGALTIETLQQAIQHVIQQHTILQTSFRCMPGMDVPVQVVNSHEETTECVVIGLDNLFTSTQELTIQTCFTIAQHKQVDFTQNSLLRIWLFRLSLQTHILLINLPALCADDTTILQFITELSQTYRLMAQHMHWATKQEEPLQYVDVAAWQDEVLQEEDAETHRQFWRKTDLSQLATMYLPLASDRQAREHDGQPFWPEVVHLPVEASLATQIRLLTDTYHVLPSAYLLTCWHILLQRLMNNVAPIIGVAFDGRIDAELASSLGLYTRLVPIDVHLTYSVPFEQLLLLINTSLEKAHEEQIYFTWADDSSSTAMSLTTPHYFPISFEHHTWPASFNAGALSFSLVKRSSCFEPFVLKLSSLQVGDSLQLELHYDPRRIDSTLVSQIATIFHTLLQAGLQQPHTAVDTLPLLTFDEQTALLAMGRTATRSLPDLRLHQLFEQQAQRLPDHLAVISTQEQLTFQQLNERANQLAWVLQQQGVGPNVLVGLCMTRSAQMIIGLLGILKAGGAYLPLDPENPSARFKHMLQESQAILLLTQQGLLQQLPSWEGKTLSLEALEPDLLQSSTSNLPTRCDAQDLAYIIYTSGSTGMPKGVMIQQSGVVNYTLALCELLGSKTGWHYATVSTLAADLGNTAIFCALASGGCLQVLDYETVTSSEKLARWAAQHPIDVLKIVPSHLSALLADERANAAMLPQRALICGGEALPVSLLTRLRELHVTCQIYNHYGPTETTIGTLVYPLSDLAIQEVTTVPLGKPITNSEVYILDANMQLVPVGIIGELYIGGKGLAITYVQQPAQTAARFIPHPFGPYGERLYRTGDLARYTAQGTIEFIGRGDSQIKLRGYRIELGEIEMAIRQHPQVRNSAVLLRNDVPGGPHLVSYVVTHKRAHLQSEQVNEFLRQSLPEYMLPTLWVQLDMLPLTANGKINRQKLPKPELQSHGARAVTIVEPRNPIEATLMEIWRDLLGVSTLSIHDNFFQVGGHSLLATQLIARIRAILQAEISISSLFEHPTLTALAQQVEQQLQHRQEEIAPLIAIEHTGEIPLSFAQQRLWFLQQLEPESTAYLIPHVQRLSGRLRVQALEQSLTELASRHENLRTVFQEGTHQPIQIIQPAKHVLLPVIDLQALHYEHRESVMHQLVKQETQHPCDLAHGPLLRPFLIRIETKEHIFLFTLHHIISDGWSSGVLVRELTTLYRAFINGQPSPLAPLSVQYADYALWQQHWLQGKVLETQLTYWKHQLAGIAPLKLPIDHPRPPVQTYRGAIQRLPLPEELHQALIALSQQTNVTLFMLLLATFQVLLLRYTEQSDISVGTPIANRTRAELEGLIGCFVNTLVLRTDLSGNPTFLELLNRVHKTALDAYSHQDIPFERLVEELQPERDMSRSPLFQVMFESRQLSPSTAHFDDLQLSVIRTAHVTTKFDLTMHVVSNGQDAYCSVEYNTDLFAESTIQRLLGHFQTLLASIVAQPDLHLADFSFLSEAERHQLLVAWNSTQTTEPAIQCLPTLFEAQVALTPDAIALVYEDECLTYHQLNRRANQLAHYLHQLGIGPETIVGVALERSLFLSISLLAVLKAGGAYLPLDLSYPPERLAFMLENTQVTVLLTIRAFQTQITALNMHLFSHTIDSLGTSTQAFPSHKNEGMCQIVYLDENWYGSQSSSVSAKHPAIASQPQDNPLTTISGANAAYVIYTSGSTGEPKGAINTHSGLCNRLLWMQQTYHLDTNDRVLQKTPTSFDVSVWELFWPLLTGAQLVMARPGGHREPTYLVEVIAEKQITTLHFVPSMLQVFLEEDGLEQCQHICQVMCSGEALAPTLQERFFARIDAALHNLYGPTEAAIDVTSWICQPELQQSTVPIGRPISNIRIYILDTQMHIVPIGITGELYIGGIGVARGYYRRPALTAERFVPDPFITSEQNASHQEVRLYRTGDRARYVADGTIEYLGRIDNQVKLRGFRIELGEIESVVSRYPTIKECVVLADEDALNGTRLVAYLVTTDATTQATNDGLRAYLEEKLPQYMLPSIFMHLATLPLLPNGKIDRKALPKPEVTLQGEQRNIEGARSPLEELLLNMWREVLGNTHIDIFDNFFTFGGHSLLATRIITRIKTMLGVAIPVRTIFEAPTVAALAPRVEHALRLDDGIDMPPLVAVTRPPQLPLSFAQQRLWFLDQLEPDSAAYLLSNTHFLSGTVDAHYLELALEELIRRHESLRTTFSEHANLPVQVIHPALPFTLPVIDLQGLHNTLQEEIVRALAQQESLHPCDLAKGPLLRIYLVRQKAQEHALFLTIHHIITDGWSNNILVRELAIIYRAFLAGQSSPLAPLPIQYADYALWQHHCLQNKLLDGQLTYWKTQLAHLSPLALPTDHPRPALQTYRGSTQSLLLPATLYEEILRLSQQENVTLFMLLLAAFQVLLMRYTDQDDIAIGTPIANRNKPEIEGVVGFFVNTLVLRTDLSANPTFLQALQRVREVALSAYVHQDVPFEKIVDILQPTRDMSRSPLFQVMLVLLNARDSQDELAGLQLQSRAKEHATSKFDLTLLLTETQQGLRCSLEFNTDLFEAATITRVLGHWQTLLEGIVHDPHLRVYDYPLLTASEQTNLLIKWNETQADYPQDLCMHQIFERQVERTPDTIALAFLDTQLTYTALDRRANQLAHKLQELGVQPDTIVGLCVERSPEMIIGLLGILKAGGAYLPLDPTYPAERLTFILTDAAIEVLVTQDQVSDRLPPHLATRVCLDTDWSTLAHYSAKALHCHTQVENLAYMIYTSGSTGTPKGVQVTHRGIGNMALAQAQTFAATAKSRKLQFASLSFDASVFETSMAVLIGGTLCLAPQEALFPGPDLLHLLHEQAITIVTLPPSTLAALPIDTLSNLQTIIVAGEACSPDLVKRWAPTRHFFNAYGPTEATVWVSVAECFADEPTLTIGRPISNFQLYIVDRYLQPVPVGIPGELCIGGIGLARGYHHRPDLTAERFIPHAFSTEPGQRMYKTGDLVRYLPNGSIEYLGRIDQQVKVHGYRIELGEIEAALGQHPNIRECAVTLYEDETKNKRLVAYVVPNEPEAYTQKEVRQYLQERLPQYMIPAFFVRLEALPITPNGKVDRRALPLPGQERSHEESASLAPRTSLEATLATIWADILHIKQVGIHDNFFELGGDSILSTQIIAHAKQMGLHFTLKHLFQFQTVAELASVVDVENQAQTEQGPILGSLPLTPIQRWFFDLHIPSPLQQHWNQVRFMQLVEPINHLFLEKALATWLTHHDALRLRFTPHDGNWQQAITTQEECLSFLHIDLSQLARDEQDRTATHIAAATQTTLDISAGPLLRTILFNMGTQQASLLLIVLHHLVVDGVSWRILLEDLQTAYRQQVQGDIIQLPPKSSSFKSWAEQLAHYAQSSTILQEQAYWLKREVESIPLLPRDNSSHELSNTVASAETLSVTLTAEETQALLKDVPPVYHTQMNDVLLTALALTSMEWTGSSSLLVDMEGHGREDLFEDIDLSRTVGWFTSLFPVYLNLSHTITIAETLQAVKEQLRAIPNHGIGYGILRSLRHDAALRWKLDTLSQADIVFNYLGQFDHTYTSSLFAGPTHLSAGPVHSPQSVRTHLLEITCHISAGQLRVIWHYSKHFHLRSTIERLATIFTQSLRSIIEHCQSPDSGGYTPSDFPDVELSQEQLAQIISEIDLG